MSEKNNLERVTSDPDVCHGKPCIKGTRIPVNLIVSLIAEGESYDSIIKDYPSLTIEDIKVAIQYAAKLSEFESYPI